MKLASLIHPIISDSGRYGSHLWSHRISGNMLELTIKPAHSENPEVYREGVIKAGQVLETINHRVISGGQAVQIRTFPDLENPQLIALIRLYQVENPDNRQKMPGYPIDSKCTHLTLMKSIASHYGLFFNNHNGMETDRLDDLMPGERQTSEPAGLYFSLCTMMDNPFVWIKTGQWIERVSQLISDHPSVPQPTIVCRIKKEERYSLNRAFPDCSYIQAVALLKSTASRITHSFSD